VEATLNLLVAARAAGCAVIYAGSSATYGDAAKLPKHEGMLPTHLALRRGQAGRRYYMSAFTRVYG